VTRVEGQEMDRANLSRGCARNRRAVTARAGSGLVAKESWPARGVAQLNWRGCANNERRETKANLRFEI
jgi:hypothetical protein